MDKDKAIRVVKQMSTICGIDLTKSSLMIMPQNAEGVNSNGDQLHIKAELNLGSRTCLNAIMDEHNLKVRETPERIIIVNASETTQ